MQRQTFLIKMLVLASVLVAVPSCGGRDADVEFLPAAPSTLQADQAGDPRPVYPAEGTTSESVHEGWVNDALDWGERRNLLAYRWCQLWNEFAQEKVDCGPKPEGVEE